MPARSPPAGRPSYYGGEEQAAERLVEHVALGCGVEAQAGVADGVFAAMLAARAGQIVPAGATPAFLGRDGRRPPWTGPTWPTCCAGSGVRTLADFAALPGRRRAGPVRLRRGLRAPARRPAWTSVRSRSAQPPPDLAVTGEYDPPLERVDMAAFAARALAERLHERLAGHGLAATRLGIEAHTAAGEELHRVWRHDGLLDAAALADRVRWQLDGWLTGTGRASALHWTAAGPAHRRHRPAAAHPGRAWSGTPGMQPGLWGELGVADERAHRALVRVQGLLGPDSVFTAVLGGGRGYADRVRLVPWGDERTPRPAARRTRAAPWPGSAARPGTRDRAARAGPDRGPHRRRRARSRSTRGSP